MSHSQRNNLVSSLRLIGALLVLPLLTGTASAFTLSVQPKNNIPTLEKPKSQASPASTPLGKYKKTVADFIGKRWLSYIQDRQDVLAIGTVRIGFFINRKGHPEELRILSNTANNTMASCCMRSITEANIPPPPPDVIEKLNNGRLSIVYQFQLYP